MAKLKKIILVSLFLGVIFAVPVIQTIIDLQDGDSPQILELFSEAPTEKHLRSFESDLEDYSFFEENMRPPFQIFRYVTLGDLGAKALAGRDGWFFFLTGVRYLTEPYFRDLPNVLVKASGTVVEGNEDEAGQGTDPVDIIVDFKRQMARRGIKLLVVIMPGKASIYPDKLTSWLEPRSLVYENTLRFMEELKDKGVDVVDVHSALAAARNNAGRDAEALYMATDTHYSGLGVKIVAKLLADRIKKESWYTKFDHTPRYERTQTLVVRRGDIPRMTKIPMQELLFPSETVRCYQVRNLDSGKLYEDEDSPVLLLGDSFSRVFQTDEPESAGLIANLAYELQLPLSSIVNDGGASTLVRQQLARRMKLLEGKRLVIWEFVERDIRFGMRGWQKISLDDGDD